MVGEAHPTLLSSSLSSRCADCQDRETVRCGFAALRWVRDTCRVGRVSRPTTHAMMVGLETRPTLRCYFRLRRRVSQIVKMDKFGCGSAALRDGEPRRPPMRRHEPDLIRKIGRHGRLRRLGVRSRRDFEFVRAATLSSFAPRL